MGRFGRFPVPDFVLVRLCVGVAHTEAVTKKQREAPCARSTKDYGSNTLTIRLRMALVASLGQVMTPNRYYLRSGAIMSSVTLRFILDVLEQGSEDSFLPEADKETIRGFLGAARGERISDRDFDGESHHWKLGWRAFGEMKN